MDGAGWGAIGAVGGAALTAVAGYFGPARAARAEQRRQAEERQREHEAGELERLIAIRSAYRDWGIYLETTAASYRALHATEETVREHISQHRAAAQRATDAAMRDGWWIGSEHMPFEHASMAVLHLVASGSAAIPFQELEDVRRMRNALNEKIFERLTRLVGSVTVLQHRLPSE